jgi:hypothetical protein
MVHDLTWQSPQIIPEPNSGCWIWLGQTNHEGYGRTHLANGRSQVAHRAVYEAHHGVKVPAHLQVDHLCRLRCCVNPDHLEVVTRLENMRRAFLKNRTNYSDTHCINGHEMVGENIWPRKSEGRLIRACRACAKKSRAQYRAKFKVRKAA